ncbi:MAG: SDR family oxidoreductase [Alphaproteobacteria bacterium]|nr:SDR family oxidoreductase [Alphaproteobacteria bacterium]
MSFVWTTMDCEKSALIWLVMMVSGRSSGTTKHGTHGLAKPTALALAKHGIRVNAIGIGIIKTAMAG